MDAPSPLASTARLREHGLRVTAQRRAILAAFDDPAAVVEHLLHNASRYEYNAPFPDAEPGGGAGEAARFGHTSF